MNKAIFLDRDGTINIDKDYLYKIEDFEYISGVVEALKQLQDMGYLLIVISNQSGIARGFYSEDDYLIIDRWMKDDLKSRGVNITASYYCPHHPKALVKKYRCECNCRKPNTGLFWQAQKDFDIDMSKSIAIGDKERDIAICKEAPVRGILIDCNKKWSNVISDIRNKHKD
ncbi:histidinol-phosphate phosphatase family domain/HAD-superfamily hydrolase, subfamily IIIA [Butyrivibrio fibrisolvens 16/4]|nr:histidinol-phosphate phosphatase family domain/HAD-superfamily hydrolase, subfamily IIIA [Butyrivibrio fibrisolvens 16/4]